MAFGRKAIVAGSWGVDTVFRFNPMSAARLKTATVMGQPIDFIWRYVSLGKPSASDITVAERDAILGAGFALLLVQHAHGPDGHSWIASAQQGHRDAAAAIMHAKMIEYGDSIAFDLEDCQSVGQPVIDHVTAWASDVASVGLKPVLYVGYAAGLSPAQLAALPFDAFWSDAGPRSVAPKQFACKQHPQTTVAGIGVDPDQVLDKGLVGMVDANLYVVVSDPVITTTT